MFTVKIFHRGAKFLEIVEWLNERNIPLDLGPGVTSEFLEVMINQMKNWKRSSRYYECEVFHFEKLEDAMLFKLTWGGDDV